MIFHEWRGGFSLSLLNKIGSSLNLIAELDLILQLPNIKNSKCFLEDRNHVKPYQHPSDKQGSDMYVPIFSSIHASLQAIKQDSIKTITSNKNWSVV